MKEKFEKTIKWIKKNGVTVSLIAVESILIGLLYSETKKADKRANILEGEKKNLEDMNKGLTREVKNLAYQLGKKHQKFNNYGK